MNIEPRVADHQCPVRLRHVTLRLRVRPRPPRPPARAPQPGVGQAVGCNLAGGPWRQINVTALDDINLTIDAGRRIGLIGHNGAGKSMLLKVMAGILLPTSGSCDVRGTVATLFSGLPDAHKDATGLENILRCCYAMGLGQQEIDRRLPEIVEWSGLGDYIHLPMQTYSNGMRGRLAASMATHVDADIYLIDEVISGLDSRCRERLFRAMDASGTTVVLASHAARTIRECCDTVVWMEQGRVRAVGDASPLLDEFESSARRRLPR